MGFPSTSGLGVMSRCPLMLVPNGPSASPSEALSLQPLWMGAKNDPPNHHVLFGSKSHCIGCVLPYLLSSSHQWASLEQHLTSFWHLCSSTTVPNMAPHSKLIRSDGGENQSNATSDQTEVTACKLMDHLFLKLGSWSTAQFLWEMKQNLWYTQSQTGHIGLCCQSKRAGVYLYMVRFNYSVQWALPYPVECLSFADIVLML